MDKKTVSNLKLLALASIAILSISGNGLLMSSVKWRSHDACWNSALILSAITLASLVMSLAVVGTHRKEVAKKC